MRRTFAAWTRAVAASVPSRVGTAALVGAWIALALLFTFVGNVALLTAISAMGESLGPAVVVAVVAGVFAMPAVSLALAQRVVRAAVERLDPVVRDGAPAPDGARAESDEPATCEADSCPTSEQVPGQTAQCC